MENSVADGILGAVVAFLLAVVTTPVGVSGAVLLLPFQASVLRVATPALTPTNLLYNVVTTPGALVRLAQENRLASPLVGRLLLGALPGIAVGAVARVEFLPGRDALYAIAAVVLLPLGVWLLLPARPRARVSFGPARAWAARLRGGGRGRALRHRRRLAARAGPRGGRYTVTAVAPAALACTAATSTVGVAVFGLLSLGDGSDVAPVWWLGAAMGVGVRPAPTSAFGSSTGFPRSSCAGSSACSPRPSAVATPSHWPSRATRARAVREERGTGRSSD